MKKYECPNCREKNVFFWAKWRSGTWVPITCEKCGAQVYTNPTINGLYGVVTCAGFLYSTYLAFNQWSWIPLLIFVIVWLIVMVMIVKFVPLTSKH